MQMRVACGCYRRFPAERRKIVTQPITTRIDGPRWRTTGNLPVSAACKWSLLEREPSHSELLRRCAESPTGALELL